MFSELHRTTIFISNFSSLYKFGRTFTIPQLLCKPSLDSWANKASVNEWWIKLALEHDMVRKSMSSMTTLIV